MAESKAECSSIAVPSTVIRVGNTFGMFAELEVRLNKFKKVLCVEHWKRHCHTIAAARNEESIGI